MNKSLLFLCISLILFSCNERAQNNVFKKLNYIDSIKNKEEILSLLTSIDSSYKYFELKDSLSIKNNRILKYFKKRSRPSWEKGDLDQNGLTDILITGTEEDFASYILCILDKGKSYEIIPIAPPFGYDYVFATIEKNTIKYKRLYYKDFDTTPRISSKNLIYKYSRFIEENKKPSNHQIQSIHYSTSACYGTCPIFELNINKNRTANWTASAFNTIDDKDIEGQFSTIVEQKYYNEIIDILNYINFETLEDEYAVNWTDDQTSFLQINYDNGKTKSIRDYGLMGTFGLERLYQLLFDLRKNQKWVPSKNSIKKDNLF